MSNKHPLLVSPVVPVVAIDKVEHAIPLAQALVEGGIPIIEVTLRSACALEAIERIAQSVPEIKVGAGTINHADQIRACIDHGASFGLSPGANERLMQCAQDCEFDFVPGVANASDIIRALEFGYHYQKFFPAEIAGGPAAIKAFSGPFQEVRFCPTGGVKLANLRDYLSLDNVVCVGGTWLTPSTLLKEQNWKAISTLCREAIDQSE